MCVLGGGVCSRVGGVSIQQGRPTLPRPLWRVLGGREPGMPELLPRVWCKADPGTSTLLPQRAPKGSRGCSGNLQNGCPHPLWSAEAALSSVLFCLFLTVAPDVGAPGLVFSAA